MNIELQGRDRIMVELSDDDLENLDITYEEMDYANIETRRVIWTLLDEASRVLGKSISTAGRMLIEALPREDGGCILFFTTLPTAGTDSQGRRLIMKKEIRPVLLTVPDSGTLLSVLELLEVQGVCEQGTEVLLAAGEYSIVLRPQPQDRERVNNLLCEFGEVLEVDASQLAVLTEHAKKLK